MGCVLGQQDETRKKKHAMYYLSKKFTEYEAKYSPLEKANDDYKPMEFNFPDEDLMAVFHVDEELDYGETWAMYFHMLNSKCF